VNDSLRDVQYENGTVGEMRWGIDGTSDGWVSSPNVQGLTDYTQGGKPNGAFLTASLSGGVPTIGFGVTISASTLGSNYPLTGNGTCTVNGGTYTAQATCTITANGFGGAVISMATPGTYSTAPTSISASFGSGSGASATPSINSGAGYDSNVQVVLQGTQGGSSPVPCSTMPAGNTFYPQGSVTPTVDGSGAVTIGSWAQATGASGCVAPVQVWASDLVPVTIGTQFANVTDGTQLGALFGTSGTVCTYEFDHGNNKIVGIHHQGGGRYGICNYNANVFEDVNAGEQYEGSIFSTNPYVYSGVQVGYSIPFPHYAVATQVGYAANNRQSNGGTIKNLICSSSGQQRTAQEFHSIVNFANAGVSLATQTAGSGYSGTGYCSITGGRPIVAGTCTATVTGGAISFAISKPGSYLPASTTPTISISGFTGGSGASATLSLSAGAMSIWDSPANTTSTDVDNVDYCGPYNNGAKITSKSAPVALNGVITPISQAVNTGNLGYTGPVGYNGNATQTSVNTSDGGDGLISGQWTLNANSTSNEFVARYQNDSYKNNLTGGGHIAHFWAHTTQLITEPGTTTDDAEDYYVSDNSDQLGTVTTRYVFRCGAIQGSTKYCFYDTSGGTNYTNGSWQVANGLKVGSSNQFQVDPSGNVTAPNVLGTAGGQTLTNPNTTSGLPTGCQQLPCAVGTPIQQTGLAGALTTTTILASAPAGVYRECAYLYTTSTTETSGTVSLLYNTTIGWNGTPDAHTMLSQNANASGTTSGGACSTFYSGAGANIQGFGNFSGAGGTILYNALFTLERLK
jgi:hypothetical protein